MKSKSKLLILLLALTLVISLAACAPAPAPDPEEPEEPEEPAEDPLRVVILLPGLISDAGWNAGGHYGTVYLNENVDNVEATYMENVSLANIEAAIHDYAGRGYDLIVGWSFDVGETIHNLAPEYPNTNFAWAQGFLTAENMSSFRAPLQESAYLSGALAAHMSETGVIGYIGGMDTRTLVNAYNAYKLGAQDVNPDIRVVRSFVGTWTDVEKGKQTAIAQFEQGADVMMGRGNGVAMGVLQACREYGVWCVGDVTDQNEMAPDLMITSTVWNVGKNLEIIIEDIRSGNFGDTIYNLGMAAGVTDIAPFHGLVPADIEAEIMELRDKIISGELVIEENTELD